MNMSETPFVSVIVPILNEAAYIEQAITSILDNNYPSDRMEIIVVDGLSNDGTRDIVEKLIEKHSNITMLDNAARIQTVAMNLGIKSCQGDIFIRIGFV